DASAGASLGPPAPALIRYPVRCQARCAPRILENPTILFFSEAAGPNANEHRASPGTSSCGRRASWDMGKAAPGQYASEANAVRVHRGIGDSVLAKGGLQRHGRSLPECLTFRLTRAHG